MKSEFFRTKVIFALTVLIGLFVSILMVEAQTATKRKTSKPKQQQQPSLVYPSQPIVEPTVVSRAEDTTVENQVPVVTEPVVQPPAEETVDDKIAASNKRIKELNARIKTLESTQKNEYDEKQKRLLLNLDILSRAEQRAESLRKQLFDIIEKESTVKTRIDQLGDDMRPESLERATAFAGSLRPEELREQRRKSLEAERKNLEGLLTQIQNNRTLLEQNVEKADLLVEKVRVKMEKDIDDALDADDNNQKP